ncbi:hypothetical protein NDU88_004576 [Pleurodeles waltl]|uniref:Uncharacterized protein n=1 Tax=Pleurodeles waltl TaxID=8319 RepID=A0AAV7UGV8_PLEWA|nr:hypothetical protein NDU88_004576 [Pleurodeles waltl]
MPQASGTTRNALRAPCGGKGGMPAVIATPWGCPKLGLRAIAGDWSATREVLGGELVNARVGAWSGRPPNSRDRAWMGLVEKGGRSSTGEGRFGEPSTAQIHRREEKAGQGRLARSPADGGRTQSKGQPWKPNQSRKMVGFLHPPASQPG